MSETMISATRFITFELIFTIILAVSYLIHFVRVPWCAVQHSWFTLRYYIKQSEFHYVKEHARILSCEFIGSQHDYERNRLNVNRGEYRMLKLEQLEKSQDLKEERYNEMDKYLGE